MSWADSKRLNIDFTRNGIYYDLDINVFYCFYDTDLEIEEIYIINDNDKREVKMSEKFREFVENDEKLWEYFKDKISYFTYALKYEYEAKVDRYERCL
jgi:hypothetical protein